jgi:hypothetical protein
MSAVLNGERSIQDKTAIARRNLQGASGKYGSRRINMNEVFL